MQLIVEFQVPNQREASVEPVSYGSGCATAPRANSKISPATSTASNQVLQTEILPFSSDRVLADDRLLDVGRYDRLMLCLLLFVQLTQVTRRIA